MKNDISSDQLVKIFNQQRANAFPKVQVPLEERIEKLKKIRENILKRQKELQEAIHKDFRKNPGEVDLTEVYPTISEINHTIKHLKKWMKPKRVGTPLALFGTCSFLHYEPRGVVLILSPWNYPFNLLINPLVATIAAGNRAIVKPSSKVPHTSKFIKKFLEEIFNKNEVSVFEGSSAISNELLKLPFDHIFFTGSPKIGKTVMSAAAKNLSTVTLELGGKSPVIVDQSANIKKTAQRLMWGKFINAGQTCVAPDYLLIHKSKEKEFIEEAKKVLSKRYGKDAAQQNSNQNFCRVVGDSQLDGLIKILNQTVKLGAQIETGGDFKKEERYLAPTLLSGVNEEMPVMKEEIFGPILPIITYNNLKDLFRLIRLQEKPLAFYIFSENKKDIKQIIKQSTAGGTCINTAVLHLANPNLPFGGVGQSGMGRYHGHFGFLELSHQRAVLNQSKWFDSLRFFYPPYTKTVRKLIELTIKYL